MIHVENLEKKLGTEILAVDLKLNIVEQINLELFFQTSFSCSVNPSNEKPKRWKLALMTLLGSWKGPLGLSFSARSTTSEKKS